MAVELQWCSEHFVCGEVVEFYEGVLIFLNDD